jgi:hypothetical protein
MWTSTLRRQSARHSALPKRTLYNSLVLNAQVATADGTNINHLQCVASALVSSLALYSSIDSLTVADVTNTILTGSTPHTYDLGMWFGDPNGVTQAVDITWHDLPLRPHHLTINNPNDYQASSSLERGIMTGQVNWNAGYLISF